MTNQLARQAAAVCFSAAFLVGSPVSAQNFFEDFETGTGSPVFINSGNQYDVDRRSESINPFPTSQGAALRVRDRVSDNGPSIEWELSSAVSAAAISYDFNSFGTADGTNGSIRFSVGQKTGTVGPQIGSFGNSIFFAGLTTGDPNGSIIWRQRGSASNVSNSTFAEGTNNSLDIFINDYDSQSVNYIRPDNGQTEVLVANTLSYWINGSLVGGVSFSDGALDNGTNLGSTEGNIGRFGFNGLTSNLGIVTHYDNLSVSTLAIPEPSAYALLIGTLALGFAAIRRRSR